MSAQASLDQFGGPGFSDLTEAEREVYTNIVRGEYGVREYARETERRPGTVGNLLRRARDKLEGST
ncbi:sigma-70 family RNA polymerase sigma factor [Halostella sp. PRR32]|uniref:sigma-70 family RNA polymerase sigma factor n=1 Tax=Halostella sp. PRR32 TaxID=3098147 RepID=UPI002B1D3187|nr:sigma-70 family RNA polymerase sigma factor [Halostella sp. PRR32]